MKWFKITLACLLTLLLALFLGGWIFLKKSAPQYEGQLDLGGLSEKVDVYFDDYGIPHIYAGAATDAYYALGYLHAQERLFQMEMIRRLSTGRMAEILGPELIEVDQFFRTLGIRQIAEKSAQKYFSDSNPDFIKESRAYLAGINEYLEYGKTPIEFRMLGIPKEKFHPEDIYTTFGYMALGFTLALTEEPLMTKIRDSLGLDYIRDIWLHAAGQADSLLYEKSKLPVKNNLESFSVKNIFNELGMPIWHGSNSWVIAPSKSSSGKVIFANDTHIKFSQPSVWYEAHLEYPGFSFYGNYLAGVPFGVIGHNRSVTWGLTIYPIDNLDLYREKAKPENPDELWENDHWAPVKTRSEIIKVKGGEDEVFEVKNSRHGPILNEVVKELEQLEDPISLSWVMIKEPTKMLQACYQLNHATGIDDARQAASLVDILGLNLMYGDINGNIAWWAGGKIPIRPEHQHSKFILDGASGKDEILGYYDFSQNPQTENPASGFVASANHEPKKIQLRAYQGYYLPANRIKRIREILNNKKLFSVEDMKAIQLDVKSDTNLALAQLISKELKSIAKEESHINLLSLLENWDGQYTLKSNGAVLFTKVLYHILEKGLADELNESDFNNLILTFTFKKSTPGLFNNAKSSWWDNSSTPGQKESRRDIFWAAFEQSAAELTKQLGKDPELWKWENVHTLTHIHPIGMKAPFDKIFNVGPYPVPGANGVPNKMEYENNGSGNYEVLSGPAIRIILDFADLENSISINPTGQSGNLMSPHYKDQAEMYAKGIYRKQMMNRDEIVGTCKKLELN